MENFRRAIGLRIKENKEVYEGEASYFSNASLMFFWCHHSLSSFKISSLFFFFYKKILDVLLVFL